MLVAATICALAALLPGLNAQVSSGLNPNLGLNPAHLDKNGVAVGFLPAWGEEKSPNTATSLNALLPKPMAVIGAYAQIQANDPNITQIEPYIEDLMRQPQPWPVFALALMPTGGLPSITQEVANVIAAKMKSLNDMGITVWLRYAHEMNGDWYAWKQQPDAFKASWEMVSATVHAATNATYMLWAPNEMYAFDGSVDNVYGGYTPYWPNPDSVDIIGLSFYHYGGHERLNNMPAPSEALAVMKQFDDLFGTPYNKPLVLGETGAAYTRDKDTGVVAPGNATEAEIKWNWLWQLSGPDTVAALPNYKCLCWFEVIKDENAAGNTIVKEEDFRLLTGNMQVGIGSRNFLAQANQINSSTSVSAVSSSGTDTNNTASTHTGSGTRKAHSSMILLATLLGLIYHFK